MQHDPIILKRIAEQPFLHADFEDLYQAGMLELCRAKERYNPELGVTFGAYARTAVRHAIDVENTPEHKRAGKTVLSRKLARKARKALEAAHGDHEKAAEDIGANLYDVISFTEAKAFSLERTPAARQLAEEAADPHPVNIWEERKQRFEAGLDEEELKLFRMRVMGKSRRKLTDEGARKLETVKRKLRAFMAEAS